MSNEKHLLVNWVTHPLVGMTVEALRWVNAFRARQQPVSALRPLPVRGLGRALR